MGRGWKRARRNLSTAPVLHPTTVLQGAETDAEDQDVCGDQRQRGPDPGVDGADRHTGAEVPAVEIDVFLVVVESGGATAPATVLLPRSVCMAG